MPHRTGVLAIVAITAVVGLSTPALAEGSPPPAARVSTAVGAAPNPNQGDYHKLLRATIADLQAYWAQEFPQVYGGMYTPVGQFVAATPTTKFVFRRVEAFRRGFFDGHNSCAAAYGQAATNTPSGCPRHDQRRRG